jgi:hypothetical protein
MKRVQKSKVVRGNNRRSIFYLNCVELIQDYLSKKTSLHIQKNESLEYSRKNKEY